MSTKLEELKTYREILVNQVDSLQKYFDAMQTEDATTIDPIDFKGTTLFYDENGSYRLF